MAHSKTRRVALVAVGGTICSTRQSPNEPASPRLTGKELLAQVPELGEIADFDVVEFGRIPSFALSFEDFRKLCATVSEKITAGCEGVVVTSGTDTLEELAYYLALTIPRGTPIAVTGAARSPSSSGSDGAANMLGAAIVATTEALSDAGPVVVVNDEIHCARCVTKVHSTRLAMFESAGTGPIGEVTEGVADVWFLPRYADYLGPVPRRGQHREVELLEVGLDLSPEVLSSVMSRHPVGVVLSSLGAGHVPPQLVPVIREVRNSGVTVVLASRCVAGATLRRTYSMPGSEMEVLEAGALPAGRISGRKARLRLTVADALGMDPSAAFPA